MKLIKGILLKDISDNFKENTPVDVYINDRITEGVDIPYVYCENGFHDGKYIQLKYIKLTDK